MKSYVVTAYRWGQRNGHSYVVGAYTTQAEAERRAKEHVDYRGGKYGCEVVEAECWEESGNENPARQVAYFECPYYGLAGDAGHFHPADAKRRSEPCPKPITIGDAKGRIFWLQTTLKMLNDRVHSGYDFNTDPDGMTLKVGEQLAEQQFRAG